MDVIYIKYQSIWNRLQVNNTIKWTYWEFNHVSKTPQTLFPLQKRGLIPAVLATASNTSPWIHLEFESLQVVHLIRQEHCHMFMLPGWKHDFVSCECWNSVMAILLLLSVYQLLWTSFRSSLLFSFCFRYFWYLQHYRLPPHSHPQNMLATLTFV